jgi:hypothetical protein
MQWAIKTNADNTTDNSGNRTRVFTANSIFLEEVIRQAEVTKKKLSSRDRTISDTILLCHAVC